MAKLSSLIVGVRTKIGTSVTTRFTDSLITTALNDVRKDLLLAYNIDEFIKDGTVSFTAGVATLPSNYLRTLGDIDRNSKVKDLFSSTDTYLKVGFTRFDDEVDKTWTTKNDSGVKKIYIFNADTVSLTLRYIFLPADLSTTDTSVDSQMPSQLDQAHQMIATQKLLFEDRQYDSASQIKVQADRALSEHFKRQRKDYGVKEDSSFGRVASMEKFIA